MIIDYFDIVCVSLTPTETNSPLIIDSDAVLPFTISAQLFKTISRGYAQVPYLNRGINHEKLPEGNPLNIRREPSRIFAAKYTLCFLISETLNHVTNG